MNEQYITLPLYAPSPELRLSVESRLVSKLRREREAAHNHLLHVRALLEEAERRLDHFSEKGEDTAAA
ncbi:MAG TPA: hypothetical protein VFD58_07830 [Blastocatellia bacterium]|nr:hypothetical protein [Blastocatellia bacterium]